MDDFEIALRAFHEEYYTSRCYFTTDMNLEETREKGQAQKGIFILDTIRALAKGRTPAAIRVTDLIKEINEGLPALRTLREDYKDPELDMYPPVLSAAIELLETHKEAALEKLQKMNRERGF